MGIAFLVGFSRVYLMQHFLMDVWAGALLGIFSSLISYFIVLNVFSKKEHQTTIFKKLMGKPTIWNQVK